MSIKTYKTKADISYVTFRNFSEVIELNDSDSFVEGQTVEYFNPSNLNDFALALKTDPVKISMPYKIDLDFSKAGYFIDCDTFVNDNMIVEFLELVVKPKYFWSRKVNLERLSISQVEVIVNQFREVAQEIKERHEWIYNPPTFGSVAEITEGTEERQAFAEHYGGYIEMTYLIAGGDVSKFEEVTNWSLDKYLFLGEYCLRKRTVENLK
jgi:hypothetical protein